MDRQGPSKLDTDVLELLGKVLGPEESGRILALAGNSGIQAYLAALLRSKLPPIPADSRMDRRRKGRTVFKTNLGRAVCADAADACGRFADESVDLVITSPPYGLVTKKEYGNRDSAEYVAWFQPFAREFMRILRPDGSLVIEIGGSWMSKLPVRSVYNYELLVSLCRDLGFYLAQEFFWWNPAKLPTPAEWVTVRRVRVKDAVSSIWWLSKSPFPKASNRKVLQRYSKAMETLDRLGYRSKRRPSGHHISDKFKMHNEGSIPSNLLAIANTRSSDAYSRYCERRGLTCHPARFPPLLPAFFINFLTDPGDLVVDPFSGSCVTGYVAEGMGRRWMCIDNVWDYLQGARGRFLSGERFDLNSADIAYRVQRPQLRT